MLIYNILFVTGDADLNGLNFPTSTQIIVMFLSVFPLHCPVLVQATAVHSWERGGISVELQPVST